jgi:DcuC family C4-dicarboxylate transporter
LPTRAAAGPADFQAFPVEHFQVTNMLVALAALIIVAGTGYLVLKGIQTQLVLTASGCLLLALAFISGDGGNVLPTLFEIFSHRTVLLALVVMMTGGYAELMAHTGAAQAAVRLATNPLKKMRSPYLAVSFTYLAGQVLNLFIPSAAGLAMLLLVAIYPTLVRLGVSPAGAAAAIGTTACLDLGPLSSTSLVAASITGMPVTTYFSSFQLPVAIPTLLAIAILHYFVQQHFDTNRDSSRKPQDAALPRGDESNAPVLYALFPAAPLFLVLTGRCFTSDHGSLLVIYCIAGSWIGALAIDGLRKGSSRDVIAAVVRSGAGMWVMFKRVVTLIVAARIFTAGIWGTGLIGSAVEILQAKQGAGLAIIFTLVLITGSLALISGSGNGAFISLSGLVSRLSSSLGVENVALALPMQLSSGLFRSMSPVAAVILIVAGGSNVSPAEIVKRTFLPMAGGVLVMMTLTLFFKF